MNEFVAIIENTTERQQTEIKLPIEYANPALSFISGYSAEQLKGQNLRARQSKSTPREAYDELWASIAQRKALRDEYADRHQDSTKYAEVARMANTLQARHGEIETLLKLQVAKQAAAIAHELNQPLVAIAAYGEVALRALRGGGTSPDMLTRAIEGCVRQVQRAGLILNELLEFLHEGKIEAAPFDINDMVRETLMIAGERGYDEFHVLLDIETGLPPAFGNRLQVQKVLLNLLSNGAEAMREAGTADTAITITVRTVTKQCMAQVTVRDSGTGLDADTATRVFEPFFTTKPNGIGLGLAISRGLIQAQGGQLWIDPEVGPGAVFHFTLPLIHE